MGKVIVAVEGPSAAGKTTWCSQQGWPVVAEYAQTGDEPDGSDPESQASYWTTVNATRWRQALKAERASPVVVCDSDPIKLHYSWSLARVGAAPWARFVAEARHVRAALRREELGFAELIMISIPDPQVLRARRDGDRTRRRRSFDLHATLAEPLREWYRAVERAGAAQVRWALPNGGVVAPVGTIARRYDVAALDRVLGHAQAIATVNRRGE